MDIYISSPLQLQELSIKQINSVFKQSELSENLIQENRFIKTYGIKTIDELQFSIKSGYTPYQGLHRFVATDILNFILDTENENSPEDIFIKRYDALTRFMTRDLCNTNYYNQHVNTLDYFSFVLDFAGWGGAQEGIRLSKLVKDFKLPYELIKEVKPSPEN